MYHGRFKRTCKKYISVYQEYYPEILDEIRGMTDGQGTSYEDMKIMNYRYNWLQMFCLVSMDSCVNMIEKKE